MKLLVTAGPTREHIDPVRFISNPSSGRMGYAIAAAAQRKGHQVCLISGPVALPAPPHIELQRVTSAREMHDAVHRRHAWCDALVMAAAVCDWRPATRHEQKTRKTDMPTALALERTDDILATLAGRKGHRLHVGFAAETGDPRAGAMRKLRDKRLDLVVANDVAAQDSGFAGPTNRVLLLGANGLEEQRPLQTKDEVADHLVQTIEKLARLA